MKQLPESFAGSRKQKQRFIPSQRLLALLQPPRNKISYKRDSYTNFPILYNNFLINDPINTSDMRGVALLSPKIVFNLVLEGIWSDDYILIEMGYGVASGVEDSMGSS